MINKRWPFLFLILILVFLLCFPGVLLAEDAPSQFVPSYTITIEIPEQAEAGQTITLTAQVRENLYDDPVVNARVYFYIRSDFFINNHLVEIGDAATDEHGIAKLDYIPNQSGSLIISALYKTDASVEPVMAEGSVNITGTSKPLYQTRIGIQYPNSFLFWLISIVFILFVIWGTFLFILYQVQRISTRGTGAKGAPFLIIVGVAAMFTLIILILVTPEAQYNFGLLP